MGYTIPTAVEGSGAPAAEFNAARDAILDLDVRALAHGSTQYIPAVGQSFSSSFWFSSTTTTLRSQADTALPILIPEAIGVDRASFSITVGATVNTVAELSLRTLDSDFSWIDVGADLATGIPLDTPGTINVDFTEIELPPGIWGFCLHQTGSYDTTFRCQAGKLVGPGIGIAGSFTQVGFPVNTNTGVTVAIPYLRLRRSS